MFSSNLTPSGQVLGRCVRNDLPPLRARNRDEICDDASIGEIKEEQEQYLEYLAAIADAEAIGRRLGDQIEPDDARQGWDAIVGGFDDLRSLTTSTTCGTEREAAVDGLRSPVDDATAMDRGALLDQRIGDVDPRFEDLPAGGGDRTVSEVLVGPPSDRGARCDKRSTGFVAAQRSVRTALVAEAGATASVVRESTASDLDDRPSDLVARLLNPLYVGVLVLAFVLWWISQLIPKDSPPLKVQLVDAPPEDVASDL